MSDHSPSPIPPMARHQKIGLVLGPAALLLLLLPTPEIMSDPAWRLAAVAIWMAVWWSTTAVPVPATGLLPLLVFPLLGIADMRTAAAPYSNPLIFLLLGSFALALTIERWNLHRRLALKIMLSLGGTGRSLIAGFMIPAWLISMLVSNTATTMMLVPVALAVVATLQDSGQLSDSAKRNFSAAVLLGIAHASSIGGIATPVGTPPNVFAIGFLQETMGREISFVRWMAIAAPFSLLMVVSCWAYLSFRRYPVNFQTTPAARQRLQQMYDELGPMGREQYAALVILAATAGLWVLRPILSPFGFLSGLSDSLIAIGGALALFTLPLGRKSTRLLEWQDTTRLPWGLLLMIGGGLSLAGLATTTGLSEALGTLLAPLGAMGPLVLIAGITLLVIFLTEINSNTATTAAMVPVMYGLALQLDMDPMLLIMPLVLAVSCAFMLPVATIPNAVVFSTGMISVPQMMRTGLVLNLIGALLVTLFGYLVVPALVP